MKQRGKQNESRHDLSAHDAEPQRWNWASARADLASADGSLNMAQIAVDRHVAEGRGGATAFVFRSTAGGRRVITYDQLAALSNRLANVLTKLGVEPQDRVFSLLGRQPEVHLTALGALKMGAVFCPLFSSFGPEPVRARLHLGEARVLVTTELLYERKVLPIRDALPNLEHVILTGSGDQEAPASTLDFEALMEAASEDFEPLRTDPHTPALLHFTSGTTGKPKGALHVHDAIVAHHATARLALDLRPEDVYWCTADPGWVTGISYGLLAPLSVGATAVVDQEEFEAGRWYEILETENVSVWYTAPTAIRMMRRQGIDLAARRTYPSLRHLASVGEPLEADAVTWGRDIFGIPVHDTWWQTETGAIMIANLPGAAVRPGSMGKPLPGIEAAPVQRTAKGIEIIASPNEPGELALRVGWPSMFRDYVGETARYEQCITDGWYLSGDLVRRDEDGYYWFVGRADDAIQSAGHLIGPFEVEVVLLKHPAVADVVVYGRPDPIAFETVAASVVLSSGYTEDDATKRDILAHARRHLGPAVAPREITFSKELPRTPSGKVLRRAFRDTTPSRT